VALLEVARDSQHSCRCLEVEEAEEEESACKRVVAFRVEQF